MTKCCKNDKRVRFECVAGAFVGQGKTYCKFNRLAVGIILVGTIAFLSLLLPCFTTPAIAAKDRLFLDLSLDYLGEYRLQTTNITDAPTAGFSAITYDRRRDRFYAVSGEKIYTLKLIFDAAPEGKIEIRNIELESGVSLSDRDGKIYESGTIISKGIALTPQQTGYVSGSQISGDAEGGMLFDHATQTLRDHRLTPFIREFDLKTGKIFQNLTIPERYIPDNQEQKEQTKGIQDDLTFAALTFNATGTVPTTGEPINLFTATEAPLLQDKISNFGQEKSRLLHYLIGYGTPMLLAEYAYPLDANLEELLSVEGVHFLSLELAKRPAGNIGKIYQIVTSGATDTSKVKRLKGEIRGVRVIKKKLVLDLQELGIALGNSPGMTFGSRLPDGTKSLLLMSHDQQITKFLLFRLRHQ
jgi:hypothetical protein